MSGDTVGSDDVSPLMARAMWQEAAACRGVAYDDPAGNPFFPPEQPGKNTPLAQALVYCTVCPVVEECAEAGRHERHGIWGGRRGGRSEGERRRRRYAREKGRAA